MTNQHHDIGITEELQATSWIISLEKLSISTLVA
jgi:hypothetical protein